MTTSVTIVIAVLLTLHFQVAQDDGEIMWIDNEAFGRRGPGDRGFKTGREFVKLYAPSSSASLVVLVDGRI